MTARAHLARVHNVPCIICSRMGQEQTSPTVAHHVQSVRDEASSYATVALCADHHKQLHSVSRRAFAMRYRVDDVDMLALTLSALDRDGGMK